MNNLMCENQPNNTATIPIDEHKKSQRLGMRQKNELGALCYNY